MKIKVTFREFKPPMVDLETLEETPGKLLGAFSEIIEGGSSVEVFDIAERKAGVYSLKNDTDVRVWQSGTVAVPGK